MLAFVVTFSSPDVGEEPGSIPLEPITIEDKPPMTIDVRYVSAYKLLSIVLQTTITSTCSDVVFHMFLFHKVTSNSKIKTNSCYYS